VQPDNLIDKLRDNFTELWAKLRWWADHPASTYSRGGDCSEPRTSIERRVLSGIFAVLPKALNLYDAALADAERFDPDKAAHVRELGRERTDALLARRVREQMDRSSDRPASDPPRSFADLIAPDLRDAPRGRK
jgi:hypothetical protein